MGFWQNSWLGDLISDVVNTVDEAVQTEFNKVERYLDHYGNVAEVLDGDKPVQDGVRWAAEEIKKNGPLEPPSLPKVY